MTAATIIAAPSPNFGPRPLGSVIDTMVIHYTDTRTLDDALAILSDPERQVSAHYLIAEDGRVLGLVSEESRAWHAGRGVWRGRGDVNSHSIGIELQNPGLRFGLRPFPEAQMTALVRLSLDVMQRWPIEQRNIIGHSDMAPGRKVDPGPYFDWRWLAEQGLGLWPSEGRSTAVDPAAARSMLGAIGYDLGAEQAVAAFQLRYRPDRVDNEIDAETAALIGAVHAAIA
ncbi:MAG: N-acetylmuramoyl-L-alanine amidase [Alphaproteobacteria bacterium]|nr:N-acetylmuramoyl-L-alanine amidase [Alphaproteobacteria bacterium]